MPPRPLPPWLWSLAFLATPRTIILFFFQKNTEALCRSSVVFFFTNLKANTVAVFLISRPDGSLTPLLIFLAYVLAQHARTLPVKIMLQRGAPVLTIGSSLVLKRLSGI